MKIKASIIILDFLKSKRVCENVESIQNQKVDFPFEVIIIDNSCSPENAAKLKTLEHYDNVQVHINKENVGYIRGNNQGALHAQGEYLFIVNPDIIWEDRATLKKLIAYMERHPEVGICGPKQINDEDGEVAMTVRAFPHFFLQVARRTFLRKLPLISKWVAHDEMRHLDYDKVQEVDWLQSSFWVIRRDLWHGLGGLDTNYFIFMSDPDLCHKCWKKGFKVMYYPKVTVHADGIRCSHGGLMDYFQKWTLRQHVKDAWKYAKRYWRQRNPRKY